MHRIISNNQVVAICDRFRWVRMHEGQMVGTIRATAQGFEALVPVLDGDNYVFNKQVYALEPGGLTGTEPVASIVEFHGAVDLQDRDAVLGILVGEQVSKDKALRLRAHIETAAQGLNDAMASQAAELFPSLNGEGYLVAAGTRINWHGTVKRAAADLWDRPENDPDNAPNLWEDILYVNGIRVIPEVITAGLAFGEGEQGWWQGELYTSKQNDNVWTPEAYPDGWEKVNGEEEEHERDGN